MSDGTPMTHIHATVYIIRTLYGGALGPSFSILIMPEGVGMCAVHGQDDELHRFSMAIIHGKSDYAGRKQLVYHLIELIV